MEKSESFNLGFWIHALVTLLAWIGPFLFNWKVMLVCYLIVFLQHVVLGKCLLNDTHGTAEEDHNTFYSLVFESLGFHPDKKRLHFLARKIFVPGLALFTVFWQVYLGFVSLIF